MRISQHSVPENEVEGLIFDVDGTLVDTMPYHYESWNQACKMHQLIFTEEQFYAFAGRPLPDIINDLVREQHQKEADDAFIQQLLKDKFEKLQQIYKERGHPKCIDSVVNIARSMKSKGFKIAAASSGMRADVIESLQTSGIQDLFEDNHIVVAADMPPGRGKPMPDIFLEAARRLNVDPKKCRAYEDGESGLQASHAAGMEVVDVRELDGYPLCDALRKQLPSLRKSRHWLK